MSYSELSPEMMEALAGIGKAMGAESMHILQPRICDHCKDKEREAFPYYVTDRDGREWAHLCNPCFDVLGCACVLDDDDPGFGEYMADRAAEARL